MCVLFVCNCAHAWCWVPGSGTHKWGAPGQPSPAVPPARVSTISPSLLWVWPLTVSFPVFCSFSEHGKPLSQYDKLKYFLLVEYLCFLIM